jgi:eukaryotic-like serine/threonine-protein kinase
MKETPALDGNTIELRRDFSSGRLMIGAEFGPTMVEVGSVLRDRYVIEQRLGQGGKGTVFKALDRYRTGLPLLHQYVAIKVLHHLPESRVETLEALRRELQCAQLLSHPNVVKVFDLDREAGVDFFTMEYLEGELLSSLLLRFQAQPLPRAYAWSIIRQIADGVQHAHDRGIVHADLKPQNIMITNAGEVRILDFGASHALNKQDDGRTARSTSSVTLAYACCELLDGRTPDPRDDLYGLACMAYELLVGEHPFQRRRATEARDFGVVPVRPLHLSRRQWNTLAKGLSWHRAGRSIRVSEWLKGLDRDPKAVAPLDNLGALKPMPAATPKAPYFRASVAATLLLITGAIWLAFVRLAPGGKVNGESLRANSVSAPMVGSGQFTSASPPSTPLISPAPVAGPSAAHLTAIVADPGSLADSPQELLVLPGQHFAEIRIHRPAAAHQDAAFVWWTEEASAKAGIDFVHQPKVSQSFPAGKNSMSVFIKLLPGPPESRSGVFYVAVADRGKGGSREVTRTTVRLSPKRFASL